MMPITHLVQIREEDCIGCVKCIEACPVDAILGSEKQMHTVIQASCIGCDLCIPACPVDCIKQTPPPQNNAYHPPTKATTTARMAARKKRLEAKAQAMTPLNQPLSHRQTYIQDLLSKLRTRK
jgi:electron transport complex protein RnfB